ncbi:hypothetical protein KY285_016962 [Solanum tuberosum]|nr:hypothetical protein KY284_018652 [Solanum tuberosum]KAH0702684.1 hypothetical protein KY285_016962 [Solanum tuberosum]
MQKEDITMETEIQANISHLNTVSAAMEIFKGEKEISNDQTDNPGDEGEISVTQSDDQLDVVNNSEQIENMTEWIEEYIIKLSTEFGVDFKGCEKKAKELFLKIDNNKQHNRDMQVTVKKKGLTELKRLEIVNKFWSYRSRSRGDIYL